MIPNKRLKNKNNNYEFAEKQKLKETFKQNEKEENIK